MDECQPIVVDLGSKTTRFAIVGNDRLRSCPTIVGWPRHKNGLIGRGNQDSRSGNRAKSLLETYEIFHPVREGLVEDYDNLEKILEEIFYSELRINPENQPILITESPLNPNSKREKVTQLMMETFNCPDFHLASAPVLSLLSIGKSSGIVLDYGTTLVTITPVFEGYGIKHAATRNSDHSLPTGNDWTKNTNFQLAEAIQKCLDLCGATLNEELLGTIVLSGGYLNYPGISAVFSEEIRKIKRPVTIETAEKPEEMALRGGLVLASRPDFHKICISKSEYDEYGPVLVRTKCFR